MPKLSMLTARSTADSGCEYEMIIDGLRSCTTPNALKDLNSFISKHFPSKCDILQPFPSYWSDLFWFTATPEDARVPQLICFIQSVLDDPTLISDETVQSLLGLSTEAQPNQNERKEDQGYEALEEMKTSTLSSLPQEARESVFRFCLPFSIYWHTLQEIHNITSKRNPKELLIEHIHKRLELNFPELFDEFFEVLQRLEVQQENLISPWEWWLLTTPEKYECEAPAPTWRSAPSSPTITLRDPSIYDDILHLSVPSDIDDLMQQENEENNLGASGSSSDLGSWLSLYKKLRSEYMPPEEDIKKLQELPEENRIAIIWDLFVVSVACTGGLDSRVQLSLKVAALFLNVDIKHIQEFQTEFALLAQNKLRASSESNDSLTNTELPEESSRWWKIGLGAAVGGGLLIATGGLAAPVLLPAVGGLASVAAATAGAVGLGTISASITIGSSTLIAGGVPLVAGLFGAAGASLFSYKVHVLTKDIEEFLFLQVPLVLSPQSQAEQNLLDRIDKNIDKAVSRLTTVISKPEVLLDIYTTTVMKSSNCVEEQSQTEQGELADSQLDELLTEFELMEDSEDSKGEVLNASDGDLKEQYEQRALAEQIVNDLEESLCIITEQLEETTKKQEEHHHLSDSSNDSSKVISIVKSPQCPPQMSVCICVCGWIWSLQDYVSTWRGVYDLLPSSEVYSLQWESAELQGLGRHLVAGAAAGIAVQVAQKYVMKTMFAATLSALSLPASALQLSGLIGHPWNVVFNRAKKCGKLLAWTLMNRVHGSRPVTLTGFSLGARLIFHCLEELARCNAVGIIENAFLLGAPACTDPKRWEAIRKIVGGRLVNAYSTTDWILFLHQKTRLQNSVAGLGRIYCPGVENVDVSSHIPGHLLYRQDICKALKVCEFGSSIPNKKFLWSARQVSRS